MSHSIESYKRNFYNKNLYNKNKGTNNLIKMSKKIKFLHFEATERFWRLAEERAARSVIVQKNFGGSNRGRSKIEGNSAVRLTRGGRGTRMGGGPRWRRCCTGGGMFCCGRRRWWVCRVSPDLACLLQHLVYGVHVCPHGIKRHSNANCAPAVSHSAIRDFRIVIRGARARSHIDLSSSSLFSPLFLFAFISDKRDSAAIQNGDRLATVSASDLPSRIKSVARVARGGWTGSFAFFGCNIEFNAISI